MATLSKRRIWPRVLAVVGAVLLVLVAIVAVKLAPLLSDGQQYAQVASIEHRADYRDPALMRAAWSLPVASRYTPVPYEYQDNPSYCGPTSIADLLHSTGRRIDQHQVIDGTKYEPTFGILLGGLTLDQEADLLRSRTGRPVAVLRPATLAAFRAAVARANDPTVREIVNFHRGPLFARGHGHFSPVLGYLADRDLVFVGDVNRNYRPYLVPTERLWQAASTIDSASGKARGLLVVKLPPPGQQVATPPPAL